jgi:hypothetical protein
MSRIPPGIMSRMIRQRGGGFQSTTTTEDPSVVGRLVEKLKAHNRFVFHNLNNQQKNFNLNGLLETGLAYFDFPLKTWFYYPTQGDMSRDLKSFNRMELAQKRARQYTNPQGNMKDLFTLTLEGILLDHIERAFHDKCKTPSRAAAHMAARIRMHGSNQGYLEKLKRIIIDLYQAPPPLLEDRD